MAEVAIIMGSSSDWATMKETAKILDDFGLAYEKKSYQHTEHQL